jgi:tetratricopeptide (TPR) repeat protein
LAATQHALGRDDDAIATLAAHAPTDGAKRACDDVDRALTRGWLLVEQARAARFGRVGSPPAHGDTADDVARSARALAEGAALFAQAEDVDAARCADPYRRAHAALNAGFAALERGELGVARAALGRAAERLPALADAMGAYARLLEGEIAEADGRNDDAVRALEHATRAAESAGTPEPLHRARVALGRVHLGRGQHREAIEVLGAAERALEPRSASAPFGEGRPSFLARHRDSAAWLVEAHLRAGDARAARSAARTAERRLSDALVTASRLTSLSEERRMRVADAIAAYREGRAEVAAMRAREHELPRDERTRVRETRIAREHALNLALDEALAASAGFASGGEARRDARAERHERTLAPAEVALDLARAGDGWVAFAEDGGRLRAHRFHGAPPKDAHALGALLMRPLAATLRTATRVLVRASDPFATLDVHALPLDGAPLIERLAVAYAIDARRGDAAPDAEAARPPESGAPGERAPAALVVGDPNDNLRFAERDARWSAERLLANGFTPTVLVGSEATSVATLSALPRASHFHFAGHAAFSGEDLWATALASSAGGAITFGDILALHRAPRTVVLSACEAARTTASSGSLGNGLGLAHAFVLAGSASVVAPTRRVDDALAATIAARVAAGVSTDSPDLASALREAQRAARREDPSADWAAFRVVVP